MKLSCGKKILGRFFFYYSKLKEWLERPQSFEAIKKVFDATSKLVTLFVSFSFEIFRCLFSVFSSNH